MTRTDCHRPSVINPTDYQFVAFEHVKDACPEVTIGERMIIRAHMAQTGGTYSHHAHGGNCHICGAHAIYTALFHHRPTNTYIRTGMDCMEKLDSSLDGSEFRKRMANALEAQAGKRKAQAMLDAAGVGAAWRYYAEPLGDAASRYEENTIGDMVGKLVRYGSMSDRAMNYLKVLLDKIANRAAIEAQRAAEKAAAEPVPTHGRRITIRGTVVALKSNDFGTRMVVRTEAGWVVMGTLPASLDASVRGQLVEFDAAVKPSRDDPKFGFFSRPTKARVLTGAAS